MEKKATVQLVAQTQKAETLEKDVIRVLSGKMSGLCQTSRGMEALQGQKEETHIKRAIGAEKRGHSVLEHGYVTLYFEGLSKIQAIILNSFRQMYTSEKSGRHINLSKTASATEQKLYDKWENFFLDAIHVKYSELVSKGLNYESLAKEYARYMLSVFNHGTSMAYTVNVHQLTLVHSMLSKFAQYLRDKIYKDSGFDVELYNEVIELCGLIEENGFLFEEVQNAKNRMFDTFAIQAGKVWEDKNVYSDMYMVNYSMSFVGFAQSHRHRTLKYELYFNEDEGNIDFYVPPFLAMSHPDKIVEWKNDLRGLVESGLYPNALMIKVREMGHIDDFALKCQERLCSRAAHEICMATEKMLHRMWENQDGFSANGKATLATLVNDNGDVKTKCQIQGDCLEPCIWGPYNCFSREV